MKTPEEWMREFETKISDAQAKAAAVKQGLEGAGASAASGDGAVTVTVAPNGALTGVQLTAAAMAKTHTQLSTEITALAREAQRVAAVRVAETFEAVNGAGSETYRLITEFLPPPEEEPPSAPDRSRYMPEPEPEPATEPPPARPRRPPPRRDPGTDLDDGDFSDESIYGGK